MNISKETSLYQCFVLTEQVLRKLNRALTEFNENIKFEIKCSDGLSRNLSNLDELLEFENPPNKNIQELVLSSKGHNYDRSVRLRLMNSGYPNIRLTMEGSEEAMTKLNSLVEEQLTGMKPWYFRFAKLDFRIIGLILLSIATIVLNILAATGSLRGQLTSATDHRSTAISNLIFITIISSPFIVGFALNLLRKRFFPIGVFALGQGLKRHADNEFLRWTIFVGFFVSLAAGFFVLFVS